MTDFARDQKYTENMADGTIVIQKLPEFSPHVAEAYFTQADAMLNAAQIFSQQQRYTLLLSALNPEHIASFHGELPTANSTHTTN